MNIHNILSDNSEDHWKCIDTAGKIVLDLGCGRHGTSDINQSSSVYMGNKGAIKVVSLDARQGEINYFNSSDLNFEKHTFICETISSTEQVRRLILDNSITCIKCDIEEWERVFYDISKEDLKNVVEFAVEYHNLDIRENFIRKFEEWGFEIHTEGKFAFLQGYDTFGVLFATKM